MTELGRGIKAGILAGLVYGIFYALSGWVIFPIFASLLGFYTYRPVGYGAWYYVELRVNPFAGIIIGPILGVILGLIYAFTYNRLPGRKIAKWTVAQSKGVVLTLIVWVIILLISIPTQLPTSLFFSEIEGALTLQIIMTAWAFFLFVPLLGVQLGSFWDRFKPKTPQPAVNQPPL
jgi:hypothetical protein